MTCQNGDLVGDIVNDFVEMFGDKPSLISRAAGRVELIGGHTDYNQGFVLAAAIDKSCYVTAAKRNDKLVKVYSKLADQTHQFELCENLVPDQDCQWANYIRGVAFFLMQSDIPLVGCDLYVTSDVPLGAGLSSSAALEIATAKAFLSLSGNFNTASDLSIAKICQKAENEFAKSPCGIMDQIMSAMGQDKQAVLLDCRYLSVEYVPFADNPPAIMVFNSMVRHSIGDGQYAQRRAQCQMALDTCRNKYPAAQALRDITPDMLAQVSADMDETALRRAKHIVNENARVIAATEALKRDDIAEFGRLISQSHESASKLYEISCEQTDFLASQICDCDGAYGARIAGGGFGGAVIAVVDPAKAEQIADKVKKAYKAEFDIDSDIFVTVPYQGSEIITV